MQSPIISARTAHESSWCKDKNGVLDCFDPDKVKIYLKGLPKKATRADLLTTFSQFGNLSYIKLPFSAKSGRNMGYGYIVFASQLDGIHLVETIRSVSLLNKSVEVSYKLPKTRGSKEASGTGGLHPIKRDANSETGTTLAVLSQPSTGGSTGIKDSSRMSRLSQEVASYHQLKPIYCEYHRLRTTLSFSLGHELSNLRLNTKQTKYNKI